MTTSKADLDGWLTYWLQQCSITNSHCVNCPISESCATAFDSMLDLITALNNPANDDSYIQLRAQYQRASKKEKTRILDKYMGLTGYCRKTAKRKMVV